MAIIAYIAYLDMSECLQEVFVLQRFRHNTQYKLIKLNNTQTIIFIYLHRENTFTDFFLKQQHNTITPLKLL